MQQDLIAFIAKGLVNQPEAVTVSPKTQDDSLTLELRVAKDDLGKIIGHQGQTIRAMRTLLNATVSGKAKVRLEIVEQEQGS